AYPTVGDVRECSPPQKQHRDLEVLRVREHVEDPRLGHLVAGHSGEVLGQGHRVAARIDDVLDTGGLECGRQACPDPAPRRVDDHAVRTFGTGRVNVQSRLGELRGIAGEEPGIDAELGGAGLRGFDRLLTDLDAGDSAAPAVGDPACRARTVEGEPADTAVEIPQAAGLHRVHPLGDLVVEADGHGGVRLEEALRAQVQIDPV